MNVHYFSRSKRVVALVLSLAFVLLAGWSAMSSARADDLDDRMNAAKRKQAQSQSQLGELRNDLSETDNQLATAYLELQEVQAQLPVAEAALTIANKEHQEAQRAADALAERLNDAQLEKESLEGQMAANEASMEDARTGVAEMARQAARGDFEMSSLGLVVGAQSTDDFVERYNMNNTAMRSQAKTLDKLRQSQAVSRNAEVRLTAVNDVIGQLKQEADSKLSIAQTKRQEAEAAKAEVQNLISKQAAATQRIEGRKAAVEAQIKEADANSAALSDEIRKIAGLQAEQRAEEKRKEQARLEKLRKEQEARDKANANKPKPGGSTGSSGGSGSAGGGSGTGGSGGGTGGSGGGSGSGGSSGGSGSGGSGGGSTSSGKWFQWPTDYRVVTSVYGWRLHPVLGYYRLHAGTDMRAYCGTPIYAARAGTVQWATWKNGFGNQVLVNHGSIGGTNVMSSYNHLTSFKTHAGASVRAGQLIGYAGNTGLSGACHLHFEVYVNGSTIDPMTKM